MVMLRPGVALAVVLAAGGGAGGLGGGSVHWGGPRKPIPPLPILPDLVPDPILARMGQRAFRSTGRTSLVSFAPDGALFSWGSEGLVRFDSEGVPRVLERAERVRRLALSPDHPPFWSSGHQETWEGERVRLPNPNCRAAPGGTFPYGEQVLGACANGLWWGKDRLLEGDFDGFLTVDPVEKLALVRSGTRPTLERTRIVDLVSLRVVADEILFPTEDAVCAAGRCAVAGKEGVWIWARGGTWRRAGDTPEDGVDAVSLGPGTRWAALTRDRVTVFDDKREICRMEGSGARFLALSPDGTRVALGGDSLMLLDVEPCQWRVPPDPLPRASDLAAADPGWVLLGNQEGVVLDAALVVTRRGRHGLVDPDALVARGDTLYWGVARREGPPIAVHLPTLVPREEVDWFSYRTEPLGDIFSGRLPAREPVAIAPDGTTYARGVEHLLVGPTTGLAPQPYDIRPFFDPESPGPPARPRPAPKPGTDPKAPSVAGRASRAGGVLGSLREAASSIEGVLGKAPAARDVWSEALGSGDLGGSTLGGRDRGPQRLSQWRLGRVAVGPGGRLVAFSFDLQFRNADGHTTPGQFTGLLDTRETRVRPLAERGRVDRLLVDPRERFLVVLGGEVRVLSLEGTERGRVPTPRGRTTDVGLSADGRWLAVGTDEALGLYAVEGVPALKAHVDTGQGGIRALAFRGDRLGLLGQDGTMIVVDAPALGALGPMPEGPAP